MSTAPFPAWSDTVPPVDIPPQNEHGVHIDITGVHNQCSPGIQSVMLNNQSVTYNRTVVLRRRERDEYASFPIPAHGRWEWIGCANDGYEYSIHSLTKRRAERTSVQL